MALSRCLLLPLLVALSAGASARAPGPAAALPFILGSDLSYLSRLDCSGSCSPFLASPGGPAQDALQQSKAAGLTHVRLRLFVQPSSSVPGGWPTPDYTYCNLQGVLALALRVQAAQLGLWLDFHYSDVWADPGHQLKPAAWASLPLPQLARAVANHTSAALAALAAQGTVPQVVQVGNEISVGALWAEAGQPCSEGGALFQAGCPAPGSGPGGNWPALAQLVAAGAAAVRQEAPSALLLIHTDLGNKLNESWAPGYIIQWYQNLAAAGAPDFDALGLSFYPQWGAGHTANLRRLAPVLAAFPGKALLLAETAYAYEGQAPAGSEFPFSPEGQAAYMRAVLQEVKAVGGSGVAWWGAEYYNLSSSALWDRGGVILPALQQGWGS
jgi:arabinogalactan endo-1,4-beta-galactosidase